MTRVGDVLPTLPLAARREQLQRAIRDLSARALADARAFDASLGPVVGTERPGERLVEAVLGARKAATGGPAEPGTTSGDQDVGA